MLANIITEITKFLINIENNKDQDTIQTEILQANPKDLAKYLETFINKVDTETKKTLIQWISILNNC